jgi:DNA helicase-2/ATP-dependent DNA helicase PcrA
LGFTHLQIEQAEKAQWEAAKDGAAQVRLVAGPGTGKSSTIERRVAHLLNSNTNPKRVFTISFTRATAAELSRRIAAFCATQSVTGLVSEARVSTMHSLALRLLRSAAVLATLFPDDPFVLDDWEREEIYDVELAAALGSTPTRASEVRLAHDAQWQTLNPNLIAQPPITSDEINRFNAFHATRRNLFCFVLPGEVVYECVTRMQQGAITAGQIPVIEHLIVDEYQDLNACDQEFVHLLVSQNAVLFIAGDDDQSIYSFRHANPAGIVDFTKVYPTSATHVLTDCFRCAPEILNAASQLIQFNPDRIPKRSHSLYQNSNPPVTGKLFVWSFQTAEAEARAIARSCEDLISNGMAGQEDQIIILISNRRLQLDIITTALANRGVNFDTPPGIAIRDEQPLRAAYSILRVLNDVSMSSPDYVVHRSLLSQLHGVGVNTAMQIGDLCVRNNQNFHQLFYPQHLPHWLTNRALAAVQRVQQVCHATTGWSLEEAVSERAAEIGAILQQTIFSGSQTKQKWLEEWQGFVDSLPAGMTLGETLKYLGANDEVEQRSILDAIAARSRQEEPDRAPPKRVRILTMHGAKGLSGKIVFIPSLEQGVLPSFRAINATGLLNEQRRLLYVSLTRAKAACILSHAVQHSGAQARLLQQQANVRLTRSQFLNEMRVGSVSRTAGLTAAERAAMIRDVADLD